MSEINAKIKKGILYRPFLCRELQEYSFENLETALSNDSVFVLRIDDKNQFAVSRWVSAKRTRSYPYARVYDTLEFSGKRITIIPILKDEGKDGDRDYLEWDTVSLMSLLGVYVIISYYTSAKKSAKKDQEHKNKITDQRFDIKQIKSEIKQLLSYHLDALHWNLWQLDKAKETAQKALASYERISRECSVEMHSKEFFEKRINELFKGAESFKQFSRDLAQSAQKRESLTIQPKEKTDDTKTSLTIKNYLGGHYYFTVDEVKVDGNEIYLTEAKHTKDDKLPSSEDVKDGLWKMILFVNLEDVEMGGRKYAPNAILKLTTGKNFSLSALTSSQSKFLEVLKKEAKENRFKLLINGDFVI
ncbi:hypothetical protein COV61_03215 [Candidatus Micrarchaeota archaeon CG11_big_fil_rev_8_21_14_0_20_47_5]|nr:MAG: hypothetical protein AUJ17_02450 [Candidatus Micrarchaeota archaeon CG1_02_47_40]PIN83390.1 MAG: hypothetical protein COV61_03215 [Candidatus Micrarchaeota archaeon CG11_big_fil_rev_8_21_14_0_20_47_5]